jgi:integrase
VHPKVVSDLLGHSQVGITLDLYSHATATMQAVAAEAMGRLLGGQDHRTATDDGRGAGR